MSAKLKSRKGTIAHTFGIGQLLAAATALAVAGLILISIQFLTLRQGLVDDVNVQAAVIADNIAAAMMFRDRQVATENLQVFPLPPYLVSVTAYQPDGSIFATRVRAGFVTVDGKTARTNAAVPASGLAPVTVVKNISYRKTELGYLAVVASTDRLRSGLLSYAGAFALAALGALSVSALVVARTRARVIKAEARLDYLAYTDPVTELRNRRATYDALAEKIAYHSMRRERLGLLFIDLDNFKAVNDTAGHSTGDALLRMVGEVLEALTPDGHIVGRIGGDEFAIIMSPIQARAEALETAHRITVALGKPFELEGQRVTATVSIGIGIFPDDAETVSELVSNADIALYNAKAAGKNRYADFRPEMTREAQRRVRMERELRVAVEQGEFDVHYQPQFHCVSGWLMGAEALLRWPHPSRGFIPPDQFIPIAEECGLINEIGRWVLLRACTDAAKWASVTGVPISIAVNVSAKQLTDNRLTEDVQAALNASGLPPTLLKLELTESVLMDDVTAALDFMHAIRAIGVELSIDDFGTGYSSLAYLQSLPINQLKIDRSFISLLPDNGFTIAAAVIGLAHGFQLSVVAEGVENRKQLAWLQAAGCDYVQGYLTGRPMSAAAFLELILPQTSQARIKTIS